MTSASPKWAVVLVTLSSSCLAAECAPADIAKLLADETARTNGIRACTHLDKAADGPLQNVGKDDVCFVDWTALNAAEAQAAPCMTDDQLQKFVDARHRQINDCTMLMDISVGTLSPAYQKQCQTNWDWLKPYDAKVAQAKKDRWNEKMSTVSGVLEQEAIRDAELQECSKYGKSTILELGAPDGVCSVSWDYLNKAETRIVLKMTPADLKKFGELHASYEESCSVLTKTIGEKANTETMCGADWSWLPAPAPVEQAKAGEPPVAIDAKP